MTLFRLRRRQLKQRGTRTGAGVAASDDDGSAIQHASAAESASTVPIAAASSAKG